MSAVSGQTSWGRILATLESLLNDSLPSHDGIEVAVELNKKIHSTLLPPPDQQICQRLRRAMKLAAEVLQDIRPTGSAPEACCLFERRLIYGMELAVPCLFLALLAEQGGQELYRLAVGVCGLVFSGGRDLLLERLRRDGDPSAEDLTTFQLVLLLQMQAISRLLCALIAPWATGIRHAVARTAAKPSLLLPWLMAAAHSLGFLDAHNDGTLTLSMLSGCAAGLADAMHIVFSSAVFWHGGVLAVDVVPWQQLLDSLRFSLGIMLRQVEQASSGSGSAGSGSGDDASRVPGQRGAGRAASSLWMSVGRALETAAYPEFQQAARQPARDGGAAAVRGLRPAAAALRLVLASPQAPEGVHAENRALSSMRAVEVMSAALHGKAGWSTASRREAEAVLLRSVPHVASAVRLFIDGSTMAGGCQPPAEDLWRILHCASTLLPVPGDDMASASEVADWCQAVDAGMRLLPLLASVRLHAENRGHAGSAATDGAGAGTQHHPATAAAELMDACLGMWWELTRQLRLSQGFPLLAASATLALPVWQLHTTACRLVHWRGLQEGDQLAVLPERLQQWQELGLSCSLWMHLAFAVNRAALRASFEAGHVEECTKLRRRLQSIAAAHVQALHLLTTKGGLAVEGLGESIPVALLAASMASPALLAHPELAAACVSSVQQTLQGSACNPQELWRCLQHLEAAALDLEWPRWAALALGSGLLAQGLELAAAAEAPDLEQASHFAAAVYMVCHVLAAHCSSELGGATATPGDAAQGSGQAAIRAALPELQGALERWEREGGSGSGSTPLAASQDLLQRCQRMLLHAGSRLAAALEQYWSEPEQRAAARLELLHAVGARSCAYLCCANLAAVGGPAAGQGEGSMKCGSCRAVWYCGTECSHADWGRGGWHRRACKALAAAVAARQVEQGQG